MFHQPSDPSLLDTVVYGLVKGNKNNFNSAADSIDSRIIV